MFLNKSAGQDLSEAYLDNFQTNFMIFHFYNKKVNGNGIRYSIWRYFLLAITSTHVLQARYRLLTRYDLRSYTFALRSFRTTNCLENWWSWKLSQKKLTQKWISGHSSFKLWGIVKSYWTLIRFKNIQPSQFPKTYGYSFERHCQGKLILKLLLRCFQAEDGYNFVEIVFENQRKINYDKKISFHSFQKWHEKCVTA